MHKNKMRFKRRFQDGHSVWHACVMHRVPPYAFHHKMTISKALPTYARTHLDKETKRDVYHIPHSILKVGINEDKNHDAKPNTVPQNDLKNPFHL